MAIATALAEAGASIALFDVGAGDQAAEAISERTGRPSAAFRADVTDPASLQAAFESTKQHLGTPTILVNCAGVTSGVAMLELPVEDWRRVMEVNVTGTFLTSQQFARQFLRGRTSDKDTASIINISSMSGFAVNIPQTQAAYNTSKAAVSMFTKSVAVEWLPLGIRVNAIAPGYFTSDMTRDFVAENPEMAREWISRIPAGRMGEPHELGPMAVYLASDASAYVVGQSFLIDGGYTLP